MDTLIKELTGFPPALNTDIRNVIFKIENVDYSKYAGKKEYMQIIIEDTHNMTRSERSDGERYSQ
jgi:hypothetical protein